MDVEPVWDEIDLATVKTRSLGGIFTLITRSFVQRLIGIVGFFLLSVFLGLPEIGLFIAVNELISILGYFSDVGLAASLIQKRDKVSISELRTTFTLQQILVTSLIVICIALSPLIIPYYHISGGGIALFAGLLFAFFLSSLKTIPSVILERQLKFESLAIVEIVENLLFYVIAVFMAWKGYGVVSYAAAVVVRSLVGTILLYRLAPWPIGFGISKSSLKLLLSFGVPYQLNSLMAVVKDRFVNIVLWPLIGATGVGIIGWAQNWSQIPLRFIMDNVTKVTFPAFSRMQDNEDQLKNAIEKTLFFISFLSFPIFAGMALVTPLIVHLIPKYSKWEVALIPLAIFCFGSAWASISTPLTNTLNAIGKVKINSYLMVMWTVLTWALTPFLAIKFGFIGVAYANGLIALSSIVPIIIAKKLTHFSLAKSVTKPLLATVSMMVICALLIKLLPISWPSVGVIVLVSAVSYFGTSFALGGQSLIEDGKKLLSSRFSKSHG